MAQVKVSVCVMTYKHEKYIAECLDSLVTQKTNFSFEIIVADDCSPDKTRDIVEKYQEKYPHLIKTIFRKKNIGFSENLKDMYSHAIGQYIAHMDGDDYALPGKLQIQADFLDNHVDCNIVWHRMLIETPIKIEKDKINLDFLSSNKFYKKDLLLYSNVSCHSSKMFRANRKINYIDGLDVIDYFLNIENIGNGYAYYLPDFFGVYRKNVLTGISSSRKVYNLYYYYDIIFFEKYPEYRREILAAIMLRAVIHLKKFDTLFLKYSFFILKNFRVSSVKCLFKNIKIMRMF